jgi:hypothetical protein
MSAEVVTCWKASLHDFLQKETGTVQWVVEALFAGDKGSRKAKLTIHLDPVPKLQLRTILPSRPLYFT